MYCLNYWKLSFFASLACCLWNFASTAFQLTSVPNSCCRARTNQLSTLFGAPECAGQDGGSEYDGKKDKESEKKIFLDISVADQPIGRLVFCVPVNPSPLPLHTENLVQLIEKIRTSIDPRCSYVGCEFRYSPQFIQNRPQYRWSHILDGKGRNAVGKATEPIVDTNQNMRHCTHSVFGGVYYGLNYDDIPAPLDGEEEGVVLTVPLTGPGRGTSSFSIVRVGASPMEWKERLLINSAILGWLEEGTEVLQFLAQQTYGPPVISDTGVL